MSPDHDKNQSSGESSANAPPTSSKDCQTTPHDSRWKFILRRWTSVVCNGVIAGTIWFVAQPLVQPLLDSVVDGLSALPFESVILAALILATAAIWWTARGRWTGWLGLRHFPAYPPLWVAVCFGLAMLAVYHGIGHGWHLTPTRHHAALQLLSPLQVALALVLLVVLGVLTSSGPLWWRRRALDAQRSKDDIAFDPIDETQSLADRLPTFEKIVEWLRDDREIEAPELDMFRHDVVARRIVRRLSNEDTGDWPTVAVVGPLGSGKSSIANLVRYYLRGNDRLQMVRVSLWPYDSPQAAVRGILDAIVRELSRYVNTLSLRGLSAQYASLIENIGGKWGALAGLLLSPSDPRALLDKMSHVLQAIDLHLILWIEDLERFSGVEHLPEDEGAIREAERLGPVRALLHLLDRADMLSVLIADTSLESRFDVHKIARFVERPPPPHILDTWHLVAAVRRACLEGYPRSIIDSVPKKSREAFDLPTNEWEAEVLLSRHIRKNPRPPHALGLILNTPRALKSALRLTLDTWVALPGEIDFDDVLAMSAIRLATPTVFAFVDCNVGLFRRGFQEVATDHDPAEHSVFKEFEELLARETKGRVPPDAVESLVRFVFPALPGQRERRDPYRVYLDRPQGLAVKRHVDYWSRYLTASPVPATESDQAALRAIAAWQAKEPNELVARMLDPELSDQIVTFVSRFKPSELCRLLEEVAERVSQQDATFWPDRRSHPGIAAICSMMYAGRPQEALLYETLERCFGVYMRTHLPLADIILHYFASPGGERVGPLLGPEQRQKAVVAARDALLQLATPGGERQLREALRNGSSWLLYWTSRALREGLPDDTEGLPFHGWRQFAPVLLKAGESHPRTVVPQIVPFVTKGDHRDIHSEDEETETTRRAMTYVAEFDEQRARRLFNYDRLLPLLANTDTPSGLDGQAAEAFRVAQEAARNQLDGAA